MKHTNPIYISALLLVLASTATGTLQQIWQIDTLPYFGSLTLDQYNVPSAYVCEDGQILVTASLDGGGQCILIIDELGQFVDKDEFDGWIDGIQGQGPSTYFTITTATPYITRYYEMTNGTLSVVEIPYQRPAPMHPRHNELVTMNGTTLTKYSHIPQQPTAFFAPASKVSGDNLIVSWTSESGASYMLQSSTNLTDWIDSGTEFSGTGSIMSWSTPTTNSSTFYRVIVN